MISMDKQYRTRDGRGVRLLCVDRNDEEFPVVFTAEDGELCACDLEGSVYLATESNVDLIEIKPSVVFWVNASLSYDHMTALFRSDTEAFARASGYEGCYDIIARRVELPIEESGE